MKSVSKSRREARGKRQSRVRKKVQGTPRRPRLSVFRSHRYIYAQIVDDEAGSTLVAASSRKPLAGEAPEGLGGKCAVAYQVGRQVAAAAKEKGIAQVVFDRGGYLYHGRVAALARGARDGGLEF